MNKINLDYLNQLGAGDFEFVAEMLQTYIDESSKDITAIEESWQAEDIKRVGFLSHRSKAAFKMLGLEGLAEVAQKLEQKIKNGSPTKAEIKDDVFYIVDHARKSFVEAAQLIKDNM